MLFTSEPDLKPPYLDTAEESYLNVYDDLNMMIEGDCDDEIYYND